MTTVPIDEKHDPDTATFWEWFATEDGQQERHCPTIALYQTEQGEYFAVAEARHSSFGRSIPIPGATAEIIADVGVWLNVRAVFIQSHTGQ